VGLKFAAAPAAALAAVAASCVASAAPAVADLSDADSRYLATLQSLGWTCGSDVHPWASLRHRRHLKVRWTADRDLLGGATPGPLISVSLHREIGGPGRARLARSASQVGKSALRESVSFARMSDRFFSSVSITASYPLLPRTSRRGGGS
jgi:hypothetical protein